MPTTTTSRTSTEDSQGQSLLNSVRQRWWSLSPRTRQWGTRLLTLLLFLAIWFLLTGLELVKPLYLPSPASVWEAFIRANSDHPIAEGVDRIVRGEQNYYMWEHLLASLQRIGIGVGAAIAVGIPVGGNCFFELGARADLCLAAPGNQPAFDELQNCVERDRCYADDDDRGNGERRLQLDAGEVCEAADPRDSVVEFGRHNGGPGKARGDPDPGHHPSL